MIYKAYTGRNFLEIPQIKRLNDQQKEIIQTVSRVLPFKTNNYVVDELIDWDNFEDDPMYILNFPQKGMISDYSFKQLSSMIAEGTNESQVSEFIDGIRTRMNPHPAGQLEYNTPWLNGEKIQGIQHKYRETALFFPSQGQTCHAYCTFCFRWPQFTGMTDMKFAMKEAEILVEFLKQNPEITDILFTGGDPMVMNASILTGYIDTILEAKLPQVRSIRIGTKSLSFWPYRYLTDPDSQEILNLFRKVTDHGIHLAFMAHFNHYRELSTDAVKEAIGNIRATGAEIRTQTPVLNHINASSEIMATLWRQQVDLGMIPYYMFVARNTGAQQYFGISLKQALEIFSDAYRQVSGICRTVRGPSMSAGPGKVRIEGIANIKGEDVFVLNFIQGRVPEWVGQPFFAKFDPDAMWLTDLVPAFGEKQFFYEKDYQKLLKISKLPGHHLRKDDLQSA